MSSQSPAVDPYSRLALNIFRGQQALSAYGDRLAAADGLTSAQWKVLGAISLAATPLSAAAIGRAMGLTRQAVQKQINLLQANELVAAGRDLRDARAPVYLVTPRGETAYAAVNARWQASTARLFGEIAPTALDQANTVLESLLAQLETGSAADDARATP